MQNKSPPPGEPEAAADSGAGAEERSGRHRRRFDEGETTIMRLDELLRGRPEAGGGQGGDKTQVVSLGDLQLNLANQTERTIRGGNLTPGQVALLQRTEPKASPEHTRGRGGQVPADSVWAPPPGASAGQTGHPAAAAPPPVPAPRPQVQLEPEEASAPGVATRIGPPPAGLRPVGNRTARPPLPPVASAAQAGQEGAGHRPPAGSPSGRPTEPTVTGLPPTEPAAARGGQGGAWPAATPPPAPPPAPPRASYGRQDVTDPGLVLPGATGTAAARRPLQDPAMPGPPSGPVAGPAPRATASVAGGKRRIVNQVVVVFSCKGGAGATALAANAAHAAATRGQHTCILDLDLQLGDALAAFGLQPKFSVAQAINLLAERQSLTRSLLASHTSGVHVLSQVGNLHDLDKITPENMATLLSSLRQHFDAIFVDGVRDFGDNALAMLDSADKVVIVCVQEVLAVRRARWTFGILRKIGFAAADISLVINRYRADADIPLASVQAMFEGAQVVPVPGDTPFVTQALNRGVPFAELRPDHPLVEGVAQVSDHLLCDDVFAGGAAGADAGGASGEQKGFFGRMFKGKGNA